MAFSVGLARSFCHGHQAVFVVLESPSTFVGITIDLIKSEEGDDAPAVKKEEEPTTSSAPPVPHHVQGTSIPLLVIQGAVDQDLDVVVEVTNGYRYRGRIRSFDAHMNATIANATVTCVHRPAFVSTMKEVFIRGSQVVDVVLPSSLLPQYEIRAASYKKLYNAVRLAKRKTKKKPKTAESGGQGKSNESAAGNNDGDERKKKRWRSENPKR